MKDWLDGVDHLVASVDDGRAALVRIGKFGSAESKTVADRRVRIPQAKAGNAFVLNPYTLWLADPGTPAYPLPFGWALLELADEPGVAVREFCTNMAAPWTFSEPSPPTTVVVRPTAVVVKIVEDRTGENRERLALLEDEHHAGRDYGRMLENIIKQSASWPEEDRLLLARLVRDKFRAKENIALHKWRDLDKILMKLPG